MKKLELLAPAKALGDIFEAAWNGPYAEFVDQEKKYRAVKRS